MQDVDEATPDTVEELKDMVIALRRTIDYQSGLIRDARFQLELEREKYLMLSRRYFGSSSEKRKEPAGQQTFEFDEAEAHADESAAASTVDVVPVKAHVKKKGGRKPVPATLETVEIVHDVPEEEKRCPCCGETRPAMADECSDEYELVPAHVVRRRHVRKKYGQCTCAGFSATGVPSVIVAPPPAKIAPKSAFSNATIAFFMVSKFCDSIPFYRMAKMLERNGLEVSRTTLCNLAIAAGRAIGDLIDAMWRDVRGSPVILMDETTLQVLGNAKGDPRSTCYMWVTLGYRERAPVILYHYHSSRSKGVPERALEGFSGFLQTDGYEGYRSVGERDGIVHVGCFAHIRRKFFEAKEVGGSPGLAEEALELIGRVYEIERKHRDRLAKGSLDTRSFQASRAKEIPGAITAFRLWLSKHSLAVAPQTKLGKAISYATVMLPKAERFIEHELLTPDTNKVENAIRPFVVGRKNWLFNDSERGAHASAGMYSLIETAKANGHEPLKYLSYLFETLPAMTAKEEREALAPHRLSPDAY